MQSPLTMDNLLTTQLEGVKDTEVVLSHVVLPPNKKLPLHYHPGEEFAYVVEGSLTLFEKDKSPRVLKVGDADVVPYKKIHTIETGDDGCRLIVFRVHKSGEPERILVEE
jgi:quercetin dioxygenase-like cupin family protein